MRTSILLLALGVALTSGCIAPNERGEPLYPVKDARPPREEVAQLGGYIRLVDGQRVDEDKTFELLPGCHVIQTPEHWGRVDSSSGGVLVDTGHRIFALLMKPGHRYHVDVSVKMMGGSTGSAAVEATEEAPGGRKKQIFYPAQTTADIAACKEAAPPVTP